MYPGDSFTRGKRMKYIKKMAMAVMLIAGFQQVSADVCKLKVNQYVFDVVKHHGEAWVKKNGDGTGTNIIVQYQSKKVNISTYEACEEPNADYVHIVNSESACGEYNDAIFCNNKGEVVINLNGIRGENENGDDFKKRRTDEAKRQFENIIKCGLISKVPMSDNEDNIVVDKGGQINVQGTFNPLIFDTPFAVNTGKLTKLSNNLNKFKCFEATPNKYWTCNEKWKMPGISADISKISSGANVTEIQVMCAMKSDIKSHCDELLPYEQDIYKSMLLDICIPSKLNILQSKKQFKDIQQITAQIVNTASPYGVLNVRDALTYLLCKTRMLNINAWKYIFDDNINDISNLMVYNIEHTERQLLLYYLFGHGKDKWCIGSELINGKRDADVKNLLIYTNGAPCFDEDLKMMDNGGVCCWNIYRNMKNLSVDVYFSAFQHSAALSDKIERENIFGYDALDDLYNYMLGTQINLHTEKKGGITSRVKAGISEICGRDCDHEEIFNFLCIDKKLTDSYMKERLLESKLSEYDSKHESLFEGIEQNVKMWRNKYPNIKFHWLSY